MNSFSKMNPISNFSFFVVVIIINMIVSNLFEVVALFVLSFLNYVFHIKKGSIGFFIKFVVPLVLVVTIINPLFNHSGETVLFYLPNDSAFTLESLLLGLKQGLIFTSIIMWFAYYNRSVSSDKFFYLFGRIMPNTSLFLSMIFRFIPHFNDKAKEIRDAQKGLGFESKSKFKNALNVFSSLVTYSLENSIETANSMKARGFSKGKIKPYSRYKANINDYFYVSISIMAFVSVLMTYKNYQKFAIIMIVLYGLTPIIIDVSEVLKWNYLKSKI